MYSALIQLDTSALMEPCSQAFLPTVYIFAYCILQGLVTLQKLEVERPGEISASDFQNGPEKSMLASLQVCECLVHQQTTSWVGKAWGQDQKPSPSSLWLSCSSLLGQLSVIN